MKITIHETYNHAFSASALSVALSMITVYEQTWDITTEHEILYWTSEITMFWLQHHQTEHRGHRAVLHKNLETCALWDQAWIDSLWEIKILTNNKTKCVEC